MWMLAYHPRRFVVGQCDCCENLSRSRCTFITDDIITQPHRTYMSLWLWTWTYTCIFFFPVQAWSNVCSRTTAAKGPCCIQRCLFLLVQVCNQHLGWVINLATFNLGWQSVTGAAQRLGGGGGGSSEREKGGNSCVRSLIDSHTF